MSARSVLEMQIHVPPAFIEIPAPEITTIFFLAEGRPRQPSKICSRDDVETLALCTAYPNEVCYFIILFRGFAVDKESNIVNPSPDGRVCIALSRVF
jgi:hypothetical protein